MAELSSAATFSPEDIVPQFQWSRGFARESYAEFCLAADTIVALAKIVFRRIDALLSD
jgi:hypothetical protein